MSLPKMLIKADELAETYLNTQLDYGEYRATMLNVQPDAPLGEWLKAIINQAVEGRFDEALALSDNFRNRLAEPPDDPRLLLMVRLRAGLLVEVGDTDGAVAGYQEALDLLRTSKAWGKRAQTELANSLVYSAMSLKRETQSLAVPGGPKDQEPYDRYARLSGEEFTYQDFKMLGQAVEYQNSRFTRYDVLYSNAALAVAYSAGDTARARTARRQFAKRVLMYGFQQRDGRTMAGGFQELLCSQHDSDLQGVLNRSYALMAPFLPIDELLNRRSRQVTGIASEPLWSNLTMLSRAFAPYAREETRQNLGADLVALLLSEDAGWPYSHSLIIDALVDGLPIRQDQWSPLWARAQASGYSLHAPLWKLLTRVALPTEPPEFLDDLVETVLQWPLEHRELALALLFNVLSTSTRFDQQVLHWAEARVSEGTESGLPWALLLHHRIEGASRIVEQGIDGLVGGMLHEQQRRSVVFNAPHGTELLSRALQIYPELLAARRAELLSKTLMTFLDQDHPWMAISVLWTLQSLTEPIIDARNEEGLSEVRSLLKRTDAMVWTLNPVGPGSDVTAQTRVALIGLKLALGVALSVAEQFGLLQALVSPREDSLRNEGLRVTAIALTIPDVTIAVRGSLTTAVVQSLQHDDAATRAMAVRVAVRALASEAGDVSGVIGMATLNATKDAHPLVVHALLTELRHVLQERTPSSAALREPFRVFAVRQLQHPHGAVREAAELLVKVLQEQMEEPA